MAIPNHTRSMPDSYPNHAPCTQFPTWPIPHPRLFPPLQLKGSCLWWGLQSSIVFGRRVPCLVCPATSRYCLPTASECRCGPTAGSLASPTVQFQKLRIRPSNHTPESYPESCPRIILPIQTSRPDYGIKIHIQIKQRVGANIIKHLDVDLLF